MKRSSIISRLSILLLVVFSAVSVNAQQSATIKETKPTEKVMKSYLIEREIPGAGDLTADQLKGVSQKSCSVLKDMQGIQWIHSYVTGNKIYCIYKAENEELIREHAKRGGFPANKIVEIANVIGPATAENN